ncbi:MAG: hypothetical protein ACP5GS_08170 [Nitrososphaeria archaeon]
MSVLRLIAFVAVAIVFVVLNIVADLQLYNIMTLKSKKMSLIAEKKKIKKWDTETIISAYKEVLSRSKQFTYNDDFFKLSDDTKTLLEQYKATQQMLMHYDNLNWNIGSILVGSNLVAIGFVVQQNQNPFLLVGAALAGMSSLWSWELWYFRHVAIYNVKNDVLYIIEAKLNMFQNRLVGLAEEAGWLGNIDGWKISYLLYLSLSLSWLILAAIALIL